MAALAALSVLFVSDSVLFWTVMILNEFSRIEPLMKKKY